MPVHAGECTLTHNLVMISKHRSPNAGNSWCAQVAETFDRQWVECDKFNSGFARFVNKQYGMMYYIAQQRKNKCEELMLEALESEQTVDEEPDAKAPLPKRAKKEMVDAIEGSMVFGWIPQTKLGTPGVIAHCFADQSAPERGRSAGNV